MFGKLTLIVVLLLELNSQVFGITYEQREAYQQYQQHYQYAEMKSGSTGTYTQPDSAGSRTYGDYSPPQTNTGLGYNPGYSGGNAYSPVNQPYQPAAPQNPAYNVNPGYGGSSQGYNVGVSSPRNTISGGHSSGSLQPGMANVCPYQEVAMVGHRRPCVRAFTRTVKVWRPNCGYSANWCVGYERRTAYYTSYRMVYESNYVTKYKCCHGWSRLNGEGGCMYRKLLNCVL
ncbi:uncharacterized protein LOC117106623 [Anneissia japonica]|uniref:uncharacterized protein LOC117106623 n=1 Tax=Anneissia japonica TaxID=1529436 RepID=UPI0014259E6A|nr:uncharacterized protein LOC117106623 [Anneissia japonica]